jgi:hypothetical protein
MSSLIEQLSIANPSLATRAKKSPLPAIRLFCLTCLGGNRNAIIACTAPDCPLFPFRMGRRPKISEDSTEISQDCIESPVLKPKRKASPGGVEALRAWREKKKAEKLAAQETQMSSPEEE